MPPRTKPPTTVVPGSLAALPGSPLVFSPEIFRGSNTLRIVHAGQVYQLRITRDNKLILTK